MFDLFNWIPNPTLKKAAYCFLGALLVATLTEVTTPMYGTGYGSTPPNAMPVIGMNGSGGNCSPHMGMYGRQMNIYAVPTHGSSYLRPY